MTGRAVIRTSCWLWVFLLLISPAMADSGRILPRPAQTFRGWGMSLAWEANDLYGGGGSPRKSKTLTFRASTWICFMAIRQLG